MSNQHTDPDTMPCDLCGKLYPCDDMYVLEDSSYCCPDCLEYIRLSNSFLLPDV